MLDRSVVGHQLAVARRRPEADDDDVARLDGGHDALAERCVDDVVADGQLDRRGGGRPFRLLRPVDPKVPENPPPKLPPVPEPVATGTELWRSTR